MIISREVKILFFIFLILIFPSISISHEGRDHSEKKQEIILPVVEKIDVIQTINKDYLEKIKPIFKNSCFNCHSTQIRYPWYYQIPGIKQWIDHDTREAKKHIDMTNDFPFKGHGNPLNDLEAIGKTIEKETMPPLRYLLMHRDARLTKAEKKAVLEWIKESRDKLILERSKWNLFRGMLLCGMLLSDFSGDQSMAGCKREQISATRVDGEGHHLCAESVGLHDECFQRRAAID